ncbi:MAG: 4Fe-4S dicluster domain-containing protein [Desulfobulbaceae bacterium]|uniref:4Fe-4S dicluster domain-containing protein n=1 Tax=Candidatus Desulfobia pelagia TaxID=2841692 RepID=A0A8J6NGG8_9BACT|nr:4Fe-4S dicluster domain-containing protein [Candidatus Desulfobia pelagia]
MLPAPVRAKKLLASPVRRNRLRPPGAVPEEIFAGKCIRCGRCVEVCPYKSIIPLDIRSGVYAGTPLVFAEDVPCYLCMKCVLVCPTGTLQKISQEQTRMGLAVVNKHQCYSWQEITLCRTCYDVCPFKNKAIILEELRPIVMDDHCTGCGICTHACPFTADNGDKAINIEPLFASATVKW